MISTTVSNYPLFERLQKNEELNSSNNLYGQQDFNLHLLNPYVFKKVVSFLDQKSLIWLDCVHRLFATKTYSIWVERQNRENLSTKWSANQLNLRSAKLDYFLTKKTYSYFLEDKLFFERKNLNENEMDHLLIHLFPKVALFFESEGDEKDNDIFFKQSLIKVFDSISRENRWGRRNAFANLSRN